MDSDALDTLDAALDQAADAPLWALTPAERVDNAHRWHMVLARVQAQLCAAMLAVEQADLSGIEGRTASTAVAAKTHTRSAGLVRLLRVGEWLERYAVFADAFTAGLISLAHVGALKNLENPRTKPYLPDSQQYLVDAAVGCESWAEFEAVLNYWLLTFDPDGEEPDDQLANRGLSYRRNRDGSLTGRVRLDPVSAEAVINAIERQTQRLRDEDKQSQTERSASQRRADALVELVCRGVKTGAEMPAPLVHVVFGVDTIDHTLGRLDPDGPADCGHNDTACDAHNGGEHGHPNPTNAEGEPDKPEPEPARAEPDPTGTGDGHDEYPGTAPRAKLRLVDDQFDRSRDVAQAPPTWPPGADSGPECEHWFGPPRPQRSRSWGPPERLPVDPHDPNRRCELVSGYPIHPKLGLAVLANAELRRLVLSSDGEILDLGRTERCFPQHLKQALLAQQRGRCATPGCDALLCWLQGDHVYPWNRGGRTSINNGQSLCGKCNKIKNDQVPPSETGAA